SRCVPDNSWTVASRSNGRGDSYLTFFVVGSLTALTWDSVGSTPRDKRKPRAIGGRKANGTLVSRPGYRRGKKTNERRHQTDDTSRDHLRGDRRPDRLQGGER